MKFTFLKKTYHFCLLVKSPLELSGFCVMLDSPQRQIDNFPLWDRGRKLRFSL